MTTRTAVLYVAMVLGLALGIAPASEAQTSGVPSGTLKGLFLDLANTSQIVSGNILPAAGLENVGTIGQLAALEIATAPVGTSTGGFTYVFNNQLGVSERSAQSFGPAFAERSLTTGKGKLSVGFNWLHASYDSIAGQDVKNDGLRVGQNGQSPVLSLSYATFKLNMTSDTFVVFAVAGVTDDLDVGVIVPSVRSTASADVAIFTSSNVDIVAGRHPHFAETTVSGVGDVALFAKYRFWHHEQGGLAGEIQVHAPTGDTNNLLGTGVTRTLLSGIWSQVGRVAPHVNVGYEFWSNGVSLAPSRNVVAKNQFKYAVGLEFEAHPKVTAAIDLVGRRLLNGGQLGYITYNLVGIPGSVEEIEGLPEGLNVISIAPGIKWNVWRKVLLTGNVLASLVNNGVRANITPVIGLDWAF